MPDRGRGTVIFDLDGTLVDSAPDLADVLDLLMAEFGLSPFGLMGTRALIGRGIPELVRAAFIARGQVLDEKELTPAVARFVRIYTGRLTARTRPFPGAAEALIALRRAGWRLVVCTNKREAAARGILADLDLLPAFALVAGPDTFGVAKPDPAHLLRAVPDLPRRSHPVVVVGDSEIDVAAARAARMPVIAVAWGYAREPVASLDADNVAESFAQVPQMVEIIAALSAKPATA